MNIQSFIGYCCGVPYVMSDKLSQALADERSANRSTANQQETDQARLFHYNQLTQASLPPNRFAGLTQFNNPLMSETLPQAITPGLFDAVTTSFKTVLQQDPAVLIAQLRSMLNAQTPQRMANWVTRMFAGFFIIPRSEKDEAARKKRQMTDHAIAAQNGNMLMPLVVDVMDTLAVRLDEPSIPAGEIQH